MILFIPAHIFMWPTQYGKLHAAFVQKKGHYDVVDLCVIPTEYIPRTNYVKAVPMSEYHRRAPDAWDGTKITDYFRLVSRNMLSPAMERTLISAIVPPEVAHVHTVFVLVFKQMSDLLDTAAMFFTIPIDFWVKSTGKSHFYFELAGRLPLPNYSNELNAHQRARVLQLSCLTHAYSRLWSQSWKSDYAEAALSTLSAQKQNGQLLENAWSPDFALRDPLSRRQALLELDVLAAIALELKQSDLMALYRIQFPVMRQYEQETFYDQNGKIVFTSNKSLPGVGLARKEWEEIRRMANGVHEVLVEDDTMPGGPIKRTVTYHAPFFSMNRDRDYEMAWKAFSQRLGIKHSAIVTKDDKISSVI